MKTLSNPTDREEIIHRLRAVGPSSPQRWGRMSAHQMVCHLTDGFRMYMSLKVARPVPVPYPRILLKWVALWAPIPWPKGFKTAPELDQEAGGTRPVGFDSDLRELQNLMDRFTRQPKDFQWQAHPHFGQMSDREWMRLAYYTWTITCGSSVREAPTRQPGPGTLSKIGRLPSVNSQTET